MASVSIKTVIEQFKLTNLTPQIDVESVKIHQPDINRPALQLAGYLSTLRKPDPRSSDLSSFLHEESSRGAQEGGVPQSHLGENALYYLLP